MKMKKLIKNSNTAQTFRKSLIKNSGHDAHLERRNNLIKITIEILVIFGLIIGEVSASNIIQLTSNQGNNGEPVWSPDGTKIAFSSDRSGNNEIWVMGADGSNPIQLTNDTSLGSGSLDWSPDGSEIIFERGPPVSGVCWPCPLIEIWKMNSDGTSLVQLTNNNYRDNSPHFSPDGTKITYNRAQNANDCCNAVDVYVMNSDGTNTTRLTTNTNYDWVTDWSQDNKILYACQIGSGYNDANYEICYINPNGSGYTRLTNDNYYDSGGDWSPDGEKIIFSSKRDGGSDTDIWMMDANGSNFVQLLDWNSNERDAKYSPDGDKIIFTSDKNGNWDIYVMIINSSEEKPDQSPQITPAPTANQNQLTHTISKTQTKIDQLKKENINTETLEKIITSAKDALQKEAYKTALELAQDASSKADKIYNAFQSYNSIKKEVNAKVDQLKRESVDTSIIEKSLSDAESEFGNGNFDLAQQLVSDAESKADKAWNTYQYIENAKNAVKEAEGISCDASDAKSRIKDALDALNKGSYDIAKSYAQDAISLANKANCGRINIEDLKALAVKYDGRTVEVSGKVRDITTVYGRGYAFTVDDGTGLIMVGYEGSMKDINNGDSVVVVGVFSESSNAIMAEKVEKTGLISGGGTGSGIGLILIIVIIVIIVILVLYFKVIKKSQDDKKRASKPKSGEWEEL